jgi:hypothetical protein
MTTDNCRTTATLTVYPLKSRYRWSLYVHDRQANPREIQSQVSYGSEAEARGKGEEYARLNGFELVTLGDVLK